MAGLFDERTGGLVTYWKTMSGITDLVGTTTSARIYPQLARQKNKRTAGSYIIYVRHSGESAQHHEGVSGTRHTVLHVFCYGDTLADADALAEAVRQNTANFRGYMSGVWVNRVECTDALDDGVIESEDGKSDPEYWVRVILRITHSEDVGIVRTTS